MTHAARAIYFIALERQAADRHWADDQRRSMYSRPDCEPDAVDDLGDRKRAALGSLRRWFVGSRTAEALR